MNNQTTTAPMTDDELALIRSADARDRATEAGRRSPAVLDRERLLGEVDRLRALLATVRTNQLGLARGFRYDAEAQHQRVDKFEWSAGHTAARAEGTAWGAVAVLQMLLMENGEVEYDEAAETTWELVAPKAGDR